MRFVTSPVWDPYTQSVLLAEFIYSAEKRIIHRYSYKDDAFYSASLSSSVKSCSFIYPTNRCGLYIISNLHDADLMRWDGVSQRAEIVRKIVTIINPNNVDVGIIAAKSDPRGQLYVGEYSHVFCNTTAAKSIFRYTVDKGLKRITDGFYITTGIAFSADGCKAYHLDGCSLQITAYDVDLRTGNWCKY